MPILSLTELSRGEGRVVDGISPDDPLWEGLEIVLLEPVRVDLRAQFVGDGVLVRGRIHARLERECRRCLAPVPIEVDDDVTLLYEPLSGEDEDQLDGEVYPLPERGDELDLRPALREQLLLRVPDFVVCSESCRGLCPTCGTNLNDTTCECVPATAESPWAELKKLKFD
jgi:uncharacterized protein